MLELPPIFRKARFHLTKDQMPPVVIGLTMDKVLDAAPNILEQKSFKNPYMHYWIESARHGFLIMKREVPNDVSITMLLFDPKKKRMVPMSMRAGDFLHNPFAPQSEALMLSLAFEWFISQPAEISVNTQTRNKPSVLARQGDSLIWSKIEDVRSHAGQARQKGYEPPAEPSGIHKRLHDVRGHWREYSSGVRVFVKSHQRGDPSLGRVTRIIKE